MTSRIDPLTLQLFVAIVEQQSIAEAAEKSHIAASAISRRISDIAAQLRRSGLRRCPEMR